MNEKQSNRQKLLSDHTTVYSLNEEWNAFLILYELKSFSQTAQKLNVTQSALSKTIKKLERLCGTAYFVAFFSRA